MSEFSFFNACQNNRSRQTNFNNGGNRPIAFGGMGNGRFRRPGFGYGRPGFGIGLPFIAGAILGRAFSPYYYGSPYVYPYPPYYYGYPY